MLIIVMLISISLVLALVFLGLFIAGMRSGQYDDTFSPSARVLFEDKPATEATHDKNQVSK